jgi:hypothetical protein
MKNIDTEALAKAIEANKAMLDKLRNDPRILDLGVKMQKCAFNLDAAGIKAGKEDYWHDMAVIAVYCITAQAVEQMQGKKFGPVPANDNKPEDMKMAA